MVRPADLETGSLSYLCSPLPSAFAPSHNNSRLLKLCLQPVLPIVMRSSQPLSFQQEYDSKLSAATLAYAQSHGSSPEVLVNFDEALQEAWRGGHLPSWPISHDSTSGLLKQILEAFDSLRKALSKIKKKTNHTPEELVAAMVSPSSRLSL